MGTKNTKNFGNKLDFSKYVQFQGGPTLMKPMRNQRVGRKR